jgi:TPR repeat protein
MHWKTSLAALLIATTFGATISVAQSGAATSEKQQLDKAGDDIEAGKYKEGAAEFKVLGDKGNPFAQCIMGVMYQNGRGVQKDIHQAISWYTKSAKQGFAGAEEHLGEIYRDGIEGINRDSKMAANWFRRAAFHGDGKAQLALGKMFMTSHTPHESNEAKVWLARACQVPGNISDEAHKAFMTLPGMQDIVKAQDNFAFAMANLAVGGTLTRMSDSVGAKGADELFGDNLGKTAEKPTSGTDKLTEKEAASKSATDALDKMSDQQLANLSPDDVNKLSEKVTADLGNVSKQKLQLVLPPAGLPSAPDEKWSGYSSVEKSLAGM